MNRETDLTELDDVKSEFMTKFKGFLTNNMVTILFVVMGILGYIVAGMSPVMFLMDIISRVSRNAFLVLSLIIPVVAGLGLNFSIVLGAMAGQTVLIFVTHWGITGLLGILLCLILVTPLAMLLGFLTGKLFNKAKGQEMIAGLILSFFAQGIYELLFLQLVGGVVPMNNKDLVMSSGVGIRTTVDLTNGLKYGLDSPGLSFDMPNLLRPTLPQTIIILFIVGVIGFMIYKFVKGKKAPSKTKLISWSVISILAVIWSINIMQGNSMINMIRIPILTWLVIILLCLFIVFFKKTKLGQDMRSVGQDRYVADSSGINVDRVRIIAVMISMVMAAWGHIIFLQNLGAFSTYGSHEQIGLYSVAALLIGGATVTNAKISHALLGVFLFHTLFIVSPSAGRTLFGNAQIGEYFRVFVAYGVIGVSLALHAWKKLLENKNKNKI